IISGLAEQKQKMLGLMTEQNTQRVERQRRCTGDSPVPPGIRRSTGGASGTRQRKARATRQCHPWSEQGLARPVARGLPRSLPHAAKDERLWLVLLTEAWQHGGRLEAGRRTWNRKGPLRLVSRGSVATGSIESMGREAAPEERAGMKLQRRDFVRATAW